MTEKIEWGPESNFNPAIQSSDILQISQNRHQEKDKQNSEIRQSRLGEENMPNPSKTLAQVLT